MSNNCGQMPVYIPTYVNLKVRNLDVVDVAATSVSCTKLTVQGNPISDVFQNVIATPGVTQFVGDVVTNNLTANRSIDTTTIVSEDITTQTLDVTGTLNAASTSVTTLYAANISTGGTIQMINTNASATLQNLSCPSAVFADCQSSNLRVLSTLTTGTLTQSSGVTTLRQTTVDSLTSGNITQNSGTANLKAVTATSVNCTGNFSADTFSSSNISNSGPLTQTGAATFATDITQTAGSANLKAVNASSLNLNGRLTVGGVTSYQWYSLPQVKASGTGTMEVLNIPGDPRTIRIHLSAIRISASVAFANGPRVQFGADSTYANTSYEVITSGSDANKTYYSSTGIHLYNNANVGGNYDAGYIVNGVIELSNVGNGTFVVTGSLGRLATPGYFILVNGYLSRANNSRFDRLRLVTSVNFDGGTVQVEYVN